MNDEVVRRRESSFFLRPDFGDFYFLFSDGRARWLPLVASGLDVLCPDWSPCWLVGLLIGRLPAMTEVNSQGQTHKKPNQRNNSTK